MSTTQKIEMSREIRQWAGVVFSAVGLAVMFYACVAPEKFNDKVEKLRKKFNLY